MSRGSLTAREWECDIKEPYGSESWWWTENLPCGDPWKKWYVSSLWPKLFSELLLLLTQKTRSHLNSHCKFMAAMDSVRFTEKNFMVPYLSAITVCTYKTDNTGLGTRTSAMGSQKPSSSWDQSDPVVRLFKRIDSFFRNFNHWPLDNPNFSEVDVCPLPLSLKQRAPPEHKILGQPLNCFALKP